MTRGCKQQGGETFGGQVKEPTFKFVLLIIMKMGVCRLSFFLFRESVCPTGEANRMGFCAIVPQRLFIS